MKNRFYFILSLIYILLDQATKFWVYTSFNYQERKTIIPNWFDLTLVFNKGIAFSMFSKNTGYIHYMIEILAVIICGYLLYHIFTNHFNKIQKIAGSLIVGGALGNLIDRFLHGHVIDFLLFYHHHYAWPVFNLADSFITIGAFIFILEGFVKQRKVS